MKEDYLEFLARLASLDSLSLFNEGDDDAHKQYKWALMTGFSWKLFDDNGFTDEEWEKRFRTWLNDQRN